ncbi:hypothetical protein [Halobacillus massiliensis]|uniref:hypothetical protein n=1 Tax=Halobacillus massiliensis TaxID=1926286 RepID=UPI0009E3C556|nr:hypothetical protein [Halobacillus massiliensis]
MGETAKKLGTADHFLEDQMAEVEKKITGKLFFRKRKKEDPPQEKLETWLHIESEGELKQHFLNELLSFQLKWASSTLQATSFYDPCVEGNEHLKLLLQRIPDHYLVLFKPVAILNDVPLQVEILILGPHEIELITFIDEKKHTIVYPTKENYWKIDTVGQRRSMVSPLVMLKRTETYLRSVLNSYNLNYSYKKIVLGPNHRIQKGYHPYSTDYIDVNTFEEWLHSKRKLSLPLKHQQLKVAEKLLYHTKTNAVNRMEWETALNFNEK